MLRIIKMITLLICLYLPIVHADQRFVNRLEVQNFIKLMVKTHKFNRAELNTIFSHVKYHAQVIKYINRPLEANPWNTYQMLFVNEWRIKHGVKFWLDHKEALKRAEKTYGVPASLIVATIGIETKYGQKTGDYRVIDALSNIAFSDSKRAPYFKKELEQFLLLTREEHLDPLKVRGSYAGAMGQPQFMPSSYRRFAVNFSKSGKIDLMHNEDDVIGSIANYYHKHGFQINQPIAIQAERLASHTSKLKNEKGPTTIADFKKYGILPKEHIDDQDAHVNLIKLNGQFRDEYWLAYRNFTVIKRYNPNDLYAMAVYQLSTCITALKEREKPNNA